MGEELYEERRYPAGHWACVTRGEELYEQSISMAFMKLMRFICKENSTGETTPPGQVRPRPLHLRPRPHLFPVKRQNNNNITDSNDPFACKAAGETCT